MPKRRYERREPSHEWQQIQPLFKDTAQIHYQIIRLVVLWGQTPKERGAKTGVSPRTIYYRANLFDEAGTALLLQPPPILKQVRHSLPPDMRQEIVNLHAQYPEFRPHELATICFVRFNRKPAPATIKLILASGPKPPTTERRYPRYAEIEDGAERRRTVIRLHANGWNAKSIVGYLEVSRQTVHAMLRRFAEEQFAALSDKSHARTVLCKVDITRCAFIFPSGVTISQGYGKNAFLGQHLEALNLPCCC
jgi:Homeodomain-like domain